MKKLIVSESLSLDGVFEGPAKTSDEHFEYAGWTEPYASKEQMEYVSKNTSGEGALLLGRVTYEHLKAGWESQKGPVADFMNNATKYVVSKTLKKASWNNSTLIKGNIVEEIKKLKKESDKDMAVLGSGMLVQTLIEHDLIDSYSLLVYPIVLGRGKRFFGDGNKAPLKLQDTKTFSSGVMFLSYTPDRK